MNELGIADPHIIEAMVNHISSKGAIAGRYDRAKHLLKRCEALEKWGKRLTERTRPFAVPASQDQATEQSDNLTSQVV